MRKPVPFRGLFLPHLLFLKYSIPTQSWGKALTVSSLRMVKSSSPKPVSSVKLGYESSIDCNKYKIHKISTVIKLFIDIKY
jgi:hypothetical protein